YYVSTQTRAIEKIMSVKRPVKLRMLITDVIVAISPLFSPVNLENLFDKFQTSPKYPAILLNPSKARLKAGGMIAIKEWIETTTRLAINFPTQFKAGVVIVALMDNGEQ